MERHILLLLIYTSLVAAQFNVTRLEKGDNFVWIGATFDCTTFTDGTATWYGDYGCECNSGLTFSTENHQCVSYVTEGKYQDIATIHPRICHISRLDEAISRFPH